MCFLFNLMWIITRKGHWLGIFGPKDDCLCDRDCYYRCPVIWWKGLNVSCLFATMCRPGHTVSQKRGGPWLLLGSLGEGPRPPGPAHLALSWYFKKPGWLFASGLSGRGFWVISVFLKIPTKHLGHPVYFQSEAARKESSLTLGPPVANPDEVSQENTCCRYLS